MTRNTLRAATVMAAVVPAMAVAQVMGGMPMHPGMKMPVKASAKPTPKPKPAPRKAQAKPATNPAPMAQPEATPGVELSPPPAPVPAATPPPPSMAGMAMPAEPEPMRMPLSIPTPGCHKEGGMTQDGGYSEGFSCYPGEGSGTSRLPANDGGMHGLHLMAGDWMLMLHGYVWGAYTNQSGPRGDRMAFLASTAMVEARRDFGGARLKVRSMLSLDPLMGRRGYPSLFATGETANGVAPLIDRQHPHDLFMELSARIELPLGRDMDAFVYAGAVAEPALGPSAFMHRNSAKFLPLAPVTHHWFDSTHISYGVVTAGLNTTRWQIEGSAFRGREPDQRRWDIETPKLDSWSVRATWNPSPYWSAQVSYGRLKSPEALEPGIDEARATASVQYARGGFSALAGFSAKNRLPGRTLTAWIGEANWDLGEHHSLFGRVENVANDELFPDPASPLHDRRFRITRGELGYAYRLKLVGPLHAAIGGSGFLTADPAALDQAYGKSPAGWTGFVKFSLGGQ